MDTVETKRDKYIFGENWEYILRYSPAQNVNSG